MIKFLADMGISKKTVHWLNENGYDATHLQELGLYRLPDEQVLEKAKIEERVLLTMDLDFGYLLAIARQKMPCVIIFRLQDETAENIIQRLSEVLTLLGNQLKEKGIVISVNEKKIRIRYLP